MYLLNPALRDCQKGINKAPILNSTITNIVYLKTKIISKLDVWKAKEIVFDKIPIAEAKGGINKAPQTNRVLIKNTKRLK